ncbi:MAG: STAS domain-containing protein [Dehalococcoidia bacterium]
MARIPIVKVGNNLIATVDEDLTDHDAVVFQEVLNARLEQANTTGVLIDVTAVETIDSFLGRLLNEIALGARLLGARTVVAGIQPAVAMTLVELGLTLDGVQTSLTPERGLAMLNRTNGRRPQA